MAAAPCRAVAAERSRAMSDGGGRTRPRHVGRWGPNAAALCRAVAAERGRAMSDGGGRTRPRHVGRWGPNAAANTPGHALQVGINRKMASHSSACQSVGVNFIPLIVESLGGWSSEAISTVRAIGRLQGQRLGTPPSESTRHLFQRLAVALCRENACLWIRRQTTLPPVVDGLE